MTDFIYGEDIMIKYNFDEIIDRRKTDSIKWSKKILHENFGDEESIPLWIADMDFKLVQPIMGASVRVA
jgi:cystathionine beta-lyase